MWVCAFNIQVKLKRWCIIFIVLKIKQEFIKSIQSIDLREENTYISIEEVYKRGKKWNNKNKITALKNSTSDQILPSPLR